MLFAIFTDLIQPRITQAPGLADRNGPVTLRRVLGIVLLPELCVTVHRKRVPTFGLHLIRPPNWPTEPRPDGEPSARRRPGGQAGSRACARCVSPVPAFGRGRSPGATNPR